ncbi:hypothetical protein M406DRAFT_108045 [Cryphonectria parasitica EP155]|uniref:Uncharacterized protein n=1 Tax=Cryphonectria parasitica (strain ATCC 38755 / EP155) TaxID=660469 RepID=A0A9P4XXN6_CRYP1|nr:uncharacterized protein M406DRAFT_108045 [Cryphonectria parasitica EP155]KAF3762811.1 hypothetical protein M406DRAFT_108045 [Cryphonectria parasitica EP155]
MTTPFRAVSSSSAVSSAGTPPASPRLPAQPDTLLSSPALPRRAPSEAATTSSTTARTPSRTLSPHSPSYGRQASSRSLRTQTLTRIAGISSTSTPRTRLARGGPPRVSVRERTRPRRPPVDPPNLVRYHWSTAVLLVLYLPLFIIPWVIICVLDVKPLTWYGSSYQDSGQYTANDIAWVPRWVRASNILACFSSALAFPVVTAVLAHASVAFVQNVRPGQKISARELLSLADQCWIRINGDRNTWWASAGATLVVLTVRVEQIQIATCNDVPRSKNDNPACHKPRDIGYVVGGYDPEPADMAVTPGNLVARKVREQLPTFTDLDTLNHIWPEIAGQGDNWAVDLGNTLFYYQKTSIESIPFFVSAFPQTFNTGMLREHAIRFNSTASCEIVPRSSFPDICPGTNPLAGEFSSEETTNRFCVPGNYIQTPWTIDRNRQDIVEDLWVDNYIPYGSPITNISMFEMTALTNLTVHCVATTTRGYFELPDVHNGGNAGDLLEYWPSQAVLEADFNDVEVLSTKPPAESNPRNATDILVFHYGADPFNSWNETTPGPLTVLINAMLGNESWFYQVQNASTVQEQRDGFVAACLRGLPFSAYTGYFRNGFSMANLDCSFLNYPGKVPSVTSESYNFGTYNQTDARIVGDVSQLVAEWFSGFGYNTSTEDALEAGMYLANEALLVLTTDSSKIDSARPIYVSNGTSVIRPNMRNPSKAVVSFLMLAEMLALIMLAVFIYRMPTFGSRLDAVHIATIGSQLSRQTGTELPPLGLRPRGLARQKYLKNLEETDGLIGVQEEVELTPLTRSSVVSPRTSATLTPGSGLSYPSPQPQGPSPSSPAPSIHGAQPRPPGGVLTRPGPRVHSFASTAHTDDEITSALDAVSEVNDPDAPPKYGDVVQADAQRAAATAQHKKLVVGGSGRITREMAMRPRQPRVPRMAYNTRPRPLSRAGGVASPIESRIRSNRSSVIGSQNRVLA